MRSNFFDRLTSIRFYLVLTFVVVVVTPTRVFSNKMKEDRSEARVIGDLPRLDITTYLNIAMEPHNAMVQVTQNWLNFCMGTMFWFTSAAIYHRVNPPVYGPFFTPTNNKVTLSNLNIKNESNNNNGNNNNNNNGNDNNNGNNSNGNGNANSGSRDFEDFGLGDILDWLAGPETSSETGSGRDVEENPVKAFLQTFATVLTGVANVLETANRLETFQVF